MYLKNKSEFNIESAQILIDKGLYAPSIHCLYYGCFQLMKYILNLRGLAYEDIDKHVQRHKISEHKYVWSEVSKLHKNKFDQRNLNNDIKDLFNYRVGSDYKNVEITFDEAKKAKSKAMEIKDDLQKIQDENY